jgi:thioredoxin reductase (NADPH)
MYDVLIVGGGPAGLTAALYLARARYRVAVIEKEKFGGQITITSEVVNYPGVERTSGKALTETMRKQAESFGAEFILAEVKGLFAEGDIKKLSTSRGELEAFGILLATGAHPRMIGFEGEARFKGHGVAYCATCDGEFFTGKEVFVVGGGFAAAEEAVFLTKYASHVTILIREEDFTCAKAPAEAARNHPNITVLTNTEVVKADGDSVLKSLTYKNNQTGEITEYKASENDTFGIFVFAGYAPETEIVKDIIRLDEGGYVITDDTQQTSVAGIYAAGDVCIKQLRQVVTAVGEAALAATSMEHYASKMQQKTGIIPKRPEENVPKGSPKEASENAETFTGKTSSDGLFTSEMITQLHTVFAKMEHPLLLKLYLDEREISTELKAYIEDLCSLTEKLRMELGDEKEEVDRPCVRVYTVDGIFTGLAFHGVPGGHEFTSFILGLYNASGTGQPIEEALLEKIKGIQEKKDIRIMVSLSCTMCPELVVAAQKIASQNPLVSAEVYDLNHFPKWRDKYQVMSVPCMVINEEAPIFGKKNLEELLDLL